MNEFVHPELNDKSIRKLVFQHQEINKKEKGRVIQSQNLRFDHDVRIDQNFLHSLALITIM